MTPRDAFARIGHDTADFAIGFLDKARDVGAIPSGRAGRPADHANLRCRGESATIPIAEKRNG